VDHGVELVVPVLEPLGLVVRADELPEGLAVHRVLLQDLGLVHALLERELRRFLKVEVPPLVLRHDEVLEERGKARKHRGVLRKWNKCKKYNASVRK
jgi:hypothetical protein